MNISGAIPGNRIKLTKFLENVVPCATPLAVRVAQTSETRNMIKASTWLPR